MSIFIFIIALIIAYFAVKIGAAAFELTGLDPEQSRFQSLSAFTGTGFTTRESELIVVHRQRRRIASLLMILGNAGIVTLVATLVNSIRPDQPPSLIIVPAIAEHIPVFLLPYLNLAIVLFVLMLIYHFFGRSKLAAMLMNKVQQKMIDRKLIQPACFEELLLNAKGYGISKIEITDKNPLLNKSLSESQLRENDILVLSIERGEAHLLNPSAKTKFMQYDKLVCFGKLDNIRKMAYEEVS